LYFVTKVVGVTLRFSCAASDRLHQIEKFYLSYRQVVFNSPAFINSFLSPHNLFFYLVDSIVHFVEHRVRDLIGFPLFRFESGEESITSCAD
jgi:hypothetical protein